MKFFDAIELCMIESGNSSCELSEKLGFNKNYIAGIRQKNRNLTLKTTLNILNECGYELAIIKEDEVPEGAIVLD